MISSTFLGQYLGILLLVMAALGIFRARLIHGWISKALRKPSVFFLIGTVEFMVGLLLVLGHQQWSGFFPSVISLFGWLVLIEGALYLFLPRRSVVHMLARVSRTDVIKAGAIVTLGLGVILTLFGFGVL